MVNKIVFLLLLFSVFQLICAQDDINIMEYPEPESDLKGRASTDAKCLLDKSELPNLQVLFLVDSGIPDPWVKAQRGLTQEMTRLLKYEYGNTIEFAAASYNNWEKDCYKMLHDFTNDESRIVSAVNGVQSDPSGDVVAESSLSMSFLMAMMDKNIHWIRDIYTLSKTNIRKYVVMFPLRTSTVTLPNPGGRKPPQGDGTDNCQISLPPTGPFIKSILDRENFFFFLCAYQPIGHADPSAIFNFYVRQLKMMGSGFSRSMWITTGDGFKPESFKPDITNNGGRLFNWIVKEHRVCEWTDPEPYVTLGL